MYHAYAACPYRQAARMARDRLKLQLWHMGMARRVSLPGVSVRHGRAWDGCVDPLPGIEPGGGGRVCT